MQLRVLHLRNYGTTFRPWMWVFVKLTISEEAIENARGWIGGMRSKRYSNGMFALAPGKSWRTYSQKRKREFLMTDPYAQSYRDYSYLVLKRRVRLALRGRPGRLIHSRSFRSELTSCYKSTPIYYQEPLWLLLLLYRLPYFNWILALLGSSSKFNVKPVWIYYACCWR